VNSLAKRWTLGAGVTAATPLARRRRPALVARKGEAGHIRSKAGEENDLLHLRPG